ncbi:MAG: BrnT family toxin [Nitrospinae bacterium]|nr:BrnT family toxin [Nitrospinota bacterium]
MAVNREEDDGKTGFEWDENKNLENRRKHGVDFDLAQRAFLDPNRVIAEDTKHSEAEDRFYCIGKAGEGILTVRFAWRGKTIRIIGAGYWRKGRELYEDQNKKKS